MAQFTGFSNAKGTVIPKIADEGNAERLYDEGFDGILSR